MTPDEKILASMTGIDKALHLAGLDGARRRPALSASQELADRLGVTKAAISHFKTVKMPADRAEQIAELYGIPLQEFAKPATK